MEGGGRTHGGGMGQTSGTEGEHTAHLQVQGLSTRGGGVGGQGACRGGIYAARQLL